MAPKYLLDQYVSHFNIENMFSRVDFHNMRILSVLIFFIKIHLCESSNSVDVKKGKFLHFFLAIFKSF